MYSCLDTDNKDFNEEEEPRTVAKEMEKFGSAAKCMETNVKQSLRVFFYFFLH